MGEASEQSFVIDTDDGVIIVAGCAHSSIEAIATRAKRIFDKEILLIIGGFHLAYKNDNEIIKTIKHLKSTGTKYLCPSHCTGERARKLFEKNFREFYIDGGVGIDLSFSQKSVKLI
jgi:7,8-dihydropterin-6-yl-methyl-4-(beta-D-ribofuranosyl)aminobenzene 5'-phosphate synthase